MASFLRKQESSFFKAFWTPAFAGVTGKWGFSVEASVPSAARVFVSAVPGFKKIKSPERIPAPGP